MNFRYSLLLIFRCEIISKEDDVDEFLESLENHTKKYITHQFKVEKQVRFIRLKKESLVEGQEIMCQMDFAENYACVIQDAIQSHYFARPQVTIHPFVVYYKKDNLVKVHNFIS